MEALIFLRVATRSVMEVLNPERELATTESRMERAEVTSGPELRAMSMWTRTKPASEEEESRPCSKARIRVRLEGVGGREGSRSR
jgi:hypothetical protein